MSTDEKIKMYIANHRACTLGLKTCQSCIFNPAYAHLWHNTDKLTEVIKTELQKEVNQTQKES